MERQNFSSGSAFEAQIGYSRAVAVGPWIFVSGTTGYNYAAGRLAGPTAAEQAEQALRNIDEALRRAGASMRHVVRVRYILPDRADFASIWPVLALWLGETRPAATMVQAGLMEEDIKVEIEVTAWKGGVEGAAPSSHAEAAGGAPPP